MIKVKITLKKKEGKYLHKTFLQHHYQQRQQQITIENKIILKLTIKVLILMID